MTKRNQILLRPDDCLAGGLFRKAGRNAARPQELDVRHAPEGRSHAFRWRGVEHPDDFDRSVFSGVCRLANLTRHRAWVDANHPSKGLSLMRELLELGHAAEDSPCLVLKSSPEEILALAEASQGEPAKHRLVASLARMSRIDLHVIEGDGDTPRWASRFLSHLMLDDTVVIGLNPALSLGFSEEA